MVMNEVNAICQLLREFWTKMYIKVQWIFHFFTLLTQAY